MDMTVAWWGLVALGVILLIAELFVGAFIVMWFGVGAIFAGFITFFAPETNIGVQVLLAASIGGTLMYTLRDRYVAKANASLEPLHTFSETTGELRVGDNGALSVFANGTFWQVANPEILPDDQRLTGSLVQIESFQNNRAVLRVQD